MKHLLVISISFFSLISSYGQGQEWAVLVNGLSSKNSKAFKRVTRTNYSEELKKAINSVVEQGYLAASIDSIVQNDSSKILNIYYYKGEKFNWGTLKISNKNKTILSKVGYGERLENNKPFSPQKLASLYTQTLSYLENNGYPFAQLKLDSCKVEGSSISGVLQINKGKLIKIDTIYIKSEERINIKSVYNYIKVKPKDFYNQKRINEIAQRIKEVPYWSESKPLEYEFVNGACNLYVYIKSIKANNFNGVLGIQPNQQGKITLTGDVKVKLLNSFYRGELIDFNWKKTQALTQSLQIKFDYPYLFNTKFGTSTQLNIYKKDTSYVDRDLKLGIDYFISGLNKIAIFYENKNSILLSAKKYATANVLPAFADVSKNNYGIKLELENLDYRFNPRKGFSFNVKGSVGTKKIKKNLVLPENLYENLNLNTFIYNASTDIRLFVPIVKRSALLFQLKGASFFNENIFANELYRIGGASSIRGFDEESLFVSSYLISTFEYRFILEQNAKIYLFYDYGWLEKNERNNYDKDEPYSFGVGISFDTKPGIFSLSYALGSQYGAPIYLKTAKVHFGFTSFF